MREVKKKVEIEVTVLTACCRVLNRASALGSRRDWSISGSMRQCTDAALPVQLVWGVVSYDVLCCVVLWYVVLYCLIQQHVLQCYVMFWCDV